MEPTAFIGMSDTSKMIILIYITQINTDEDDSIILLY